MTATTIHAAIMAFVLTELIPSHVNVQKDGLEIPVMKVSTNLRNNGLKSCLLLEI